MLSSELANSGGHLGEPLHPEILYIPRNKKKDRRVTEVGNRTAYERSPSDQAEWGRQPGDRMTRFRHTMAMSAPPFVWYQTMCRIELFKMPE